MLGFSALCELALCELPRAPTPPSTSNYGGVWTYGLKHWKRLRGELDESEDAEIAPETLLAVGKVVERIPEPVSTYDTESRLLLRLEAERRRQEWSEAQLDVLEAYRAGMREYFADQRALARVEREARETAARAAKRRRHLILLLLDS